ncbi:hypothetical protein AKJ08_3287 [Vulgatibacter incomptus]|uniref:Uncharacterized protein n=1 Tax=Vulgatibacter incomptus TaxID=1391653 RepID=A0A0K1PHA2_9BACT|nr:hypothetical protein AKJ08_3287 [Vulgatibacter incomptus]
MVPAEFCSLLDASRGGCVGWRRPGLGNGRMPEGRSNECRASR